MFRRAVIVAVFAVGLVAPQAALAQRPGAGENVGPAAQQQQQAARRGVQEGRLVPLAQVISTINRRTPGRHLDSGMSRMGDRQVYRVRWQTNDGRTIDYVVDAQSGAILSANGG